MIVEQKKAHYFHSGPFLHSALNFAKCVQCGRGLAPDSDSSVTVVLTETLLSGASPLPHFLHALFDGGIINGLDERAIQITVDIELRIIGFTSCQYINVIYRITVHIRLDGNSDRCQRVTR
ncbi:hypothetical protein [Pseudomonas trivialis]|uniref:hypothetical protein n=1 Tax=Pseudomonas trivialis TaxID=200450 RepID=UPI001112EEA6|nr:hypothetical protein [Pseudomonas trivialis]